METHTNNIIEKTNITLQGIDLSESDIFEKASNAVNILEQVFLDLKEYISNYQFADDTEEILFFKNIKPQLFSKLIYYQKIYTIELSRPSAGIEAEKEYLKEELKRLRSFFNRNIDIYKYYRTGCTHLDKYYFLRGKPDIELKLDSFYFERDPVFSTSFDFKIAKLLANEMLSIYLSEELYELDNFKKDNSEKSNNNFVKLTWTGSKSNLIELIYALERAGNINNGNVNIKELTHYMELIFNIDLGDVYRTFLGLRDRKGDNRTLFLNTLTKLLNDRMDELDSK